MRTNPEKQLFFDDVAPRWMRDEEARSARLAELFSAGVLPVTGPVLDVGTGTGILIPHLLAAGCRAIHACEISGAMLQSAWTRYAGARGVHFLRCDAQRLSLRDASVATVHCFSVYPHFDTPDRALAEFRRVLRPGGKLCILHLMDHTELNALHSDAGRAVAHDLLPPMDALSATLQRCGYHVLHAEERPGLYLLCAQLPPLH
ncbi:MAG: class I SAM-dependent methyltransferase [Bacteroidota bacterium]|nr:class I SAM-dependent methyltransferase [Bacteroidota bacterium]